MAQENEKLTAARLDKLKSKPGMHADGSGLYLQVKEKKDAVSGASWVLRYQLNGKPHWMGLGPLSLFGLREARARALDARRLRHDGIDPIEARRRARAKLRLEAAKTITFKIAAERYIEGHKAGWRNAKHAAQWTATLTTYVYPEIGTLPVQAIDTALVVKVLEPIWTEKPETASRVRGRIEAILDWSRVRGFREGENPARWRGHLDHLLPAHGKVRRVEHHAALPYSEMGEFAAALRKQDGTAARALEFTILTAARTGETIRATWGEFDLDKKIWTVPAARMKAGREHRVPLSDRAVEILMAVKPETPKASAHVFCSGATENPLSNMAMAMTLRRMKRDELTVHGFRSSFRDWACERTNFPAEAAEMALAHAVSDKVEGAYRRGDMFERRRRMMAEWAKYCATPSRNAQGNVTTLHNIA